MYSSVSAANRAQPPGRQPAGGECPSREHKLSLCFALPPLGPRAGSLSLPPPAALPTHSQRFASPPGPRRACACVGAGEMPAADVLLTTAHVHRTGHLSLYICHVSVLLRCLLCYCAASLGRRNTSSTSSSSKIPHCGHWSRYGTRPTLSTSNPIGVNTLASKDATAVSQQQFGDMGSFSVGATRPCGVSTNGPNGSTSAISNCVCPGTIIL
jgi:hypothetical protein